MVWHQKTTILQISPILPIFQNPSGGSVVSFHEELSRGAHVWSPAHELTWGAPHNSSWVRSSHELMSWAHHISSWAELLQRSRERTPHMSSWADQLIKSSAWRVLDQGELPWGAQLSWGGPVRSSAHELPWGAQLVSSREELSAHSVSQSVSQSVN